MQFGMLSKELSLAALSRNTSVRSVRQNFDLIDLQNIDYFQDFDQPSSMRPTYSLWYHYMVF